MRRYFVFYIAFVQSMSAFPVPFFFCSRSLINVFVAFRHFCTWGQLQVIKFSRLSSASLIVSWLSVWQFYHTMCLMRSPLLMWHSEIDSVCPWCVSEFFSCRVATVFVDFIVWSFDGFLWCTFIMGLFVFPQWPEYSLVDRYGIFYPFFIDLYSIWKFFTYFEWTQLNAQQLVLFSVGIASVADAVSGDRSM